MEHMDEIGNDVLGLLRAAEVDIHSTRSWIRKQTPTSYRSIGEIKAERAAFGGGFSAQNVTLILNTSTAPHI